MIIINYLLVILKYFEVKTFHIEKLLLLCNKANTWIELSLLHWSYTCRLFYYFNKSIKTCYEFIYNKGRLIYSSLAFVRINFRNLMLFKLVSLPYHSLIVNTWILTKQQRWFNLFIIQRSIFGDELMYYGRFSNDFYKLVELYAIVTRDGNINSNRYELRTVCCIFASCIKVDVAAIIRYLRSFQRLSNLVGQVEHLGAARFMGAPA